MRLSEIMRTRIVTIGPDDTASAAWTRMRRRGIRHLVVVDGTQLVGVVSERDLGGRTGDEVRAGRRVRDLMTSRVASAGPETTLPDAADLMRARLIGSLPVLDGDRLVGIVTATDVFEALGRGARASLSRAERQLLRAPTTSKRLGGRPVVRPRVRAPSETPRRRVPGEPPAEPAPGPLELPAGRTDAPEFPATIRVTGVGLDPEERAYIRQRLRVKLGKFAGSIERVTVRVGDVNGARGGGDQSCRVKLVLSGLPSVVVEHRAAAVRPAVTGALTAAERSVRRAVERRHARPVEGIGGDEIDQYD